MATLIDDIQPWPDKLLLYPHKITWEHNIPLPAKAESERLVIPENEPLRLECKHFLNCITSGKRPLTDANEGLGVLTILNASQLSPDDGGLKIFLNPANGGHGKQTSLEMQPVSHDGGTSARDAVFFGPSISLYQCVNPRADLTKMAQVRPTRVKPRRQSVPTQQLSAV